ncbi:MAG: HAMP domain-containing histidine kinase [Proteobacteria bacterium]|nr:HAMP domain-containing histidine kinase [Pseudomonadota bacterium]MBU4296361.1 HAMP domain-containing histidine kinase [Pseudomonadota bacterium]MCG2749228.1 HAMP domain-containing histidine kinase [Desulfobulbaceae bacterium]
MSHDLKSPMVGMLGLIRLLHKRYSDQLDAKGKKFCQQILKGAEQMSALVEEINAYIKAKETVFHFEPVDPLDILHTVRDEFAPLLNLHGISWEEPNSLPPMTMDRMSMIRVFRNLTDNAFKYGGEKLQTIVVEYRDEGDHHLLSFFDDVVGIKKEDTGKIFEVFDRHGNARGIDGTGLGLAIVREILEKHRGSVWVESAPAPGVTFYLSLPKKLA